MDFDKPKVYGDTSITDGLVYLSIKEVLVLKYESSINIIASYKQ